MYRNALENLNHARSTSSLNREEFRISYAKMVLLAAHIEMDILDSDSDGIIQGNDLKAFITLTQRAANVVLPSKVLTNWTVCYMRREIKSAKTNFLFRNWR